MLRINDRFYLSADAHNYILSKQVGQKEHTVPVGYYTTMEGLLQGFVKHQIREIVDNEGNQLSVIELQTQLQNIQADLQKLSTKLEQRGKTVFESNN